MNILKNKITVAVLALMALSMWSCSDSLLKETPRSSFTAAYFQTPAGVQSGLTALYQNLRQEYGGYYLSACENGTDEYTYGSSADANQKDIDLTPGVGSGITSSSCRSDVLWNAMFTNINTANGVIQYGAGAGIDPSLIAEANFFRAFNYFMLVQTFGGVPLDLGSGELQMNTSAVTTSVRNTVPEVYTKAIFPDLLTAINNLPDAPRLTGTVTKTVARLYLSKAYLTYAWWLQNPNNIPTYPTCDRSDPDGKDATWYFQQAYTVATTAIGDPGPYGLQPTFYDLNVASNDRNNEELLYADHIGNNDSFNQGNSDGNSNQAVGSPQNNACWLTTWNYPVIGGGAPVQRELAQWGGRPWTRMATPVEVSTKTFADKTNDSRYDGTFATVLRGNWHQPGASDAQLATATINNANGLSVAPGDPVLSFINEDDPTITYPSDYKGTSSVGAGTLPSRADYVVGPSAFSRGIYPSLWKIGPAGNGSVVIGSSNPANQSNIRPWFIAKFSELYFIAAEAAVKLGDNENAYKLINVIRARAGHWKFSNALNQTVTDDGSASAAMVAATPATIDIDYILAERSREYFGEGYRWYDLVRTQTWARIAATYSICDVATVGGSTNETNHTLKTYTRTSIDAHYYLRPIPSSQISALQMDDAEKMAYQNPGY